MLNRLSVLLAFLIVLPIGIGAKAADSDVAMDPRVTLRAYSALVDMEFENTRAALRLLAASENAKSGEWSRIKVPLAVLAENTPDGAATWFAQRDGSYFTVGQGRTGQNLSDRTYFPALMAGEEVTGVLVISKSTNKRTAIVAVPVRVNGRTVGALGVSMSMEKVAASVQRKIDFPQGITFYALDDRGEIALHNDASLIFEFASQLGSPTLTDAVKAMLSKPEGTVHYDFQGAQRTAVFKKSEVTGWIYALRW